MFNKHLVQRAADEDLAWKNPMNIFAESKFENQKKSPNCIFSLPGF